MSKLAVVTKYMNKLDSICIERHVYDCLDVLVNRFSHAEYHDLPKLSNKFDALDVDTSRYMTAAHTQCNWTPPQGKYN